MAVEKDKNMAVSIRVADFNKGNANYFRAHPSLALCLQKVFSKVYDVTKEKVTSLRYYSLDNFLTHSTLQTTKYMYNIYFN